MRDAVRGVPGLLFIIFAHPIVGLFARDELRLRVLRPGHGPHPVVQRSRNLACFWLWEIPLAFGPPGVFLAIAVGYATLALVTTVLFRCGRWKLRTVCVEGRVPCLYIRPNVV